MGLVITASNYSPELAIVKQVEKLLALGMQVLEKALSRSVEILNQSSRADSLETQVLVHTASCFAVAAQFPACRQALSAMPGLARDLCRGLYFQVSIPSPTCSYPSPSVGVFRQVAAPASRHTLSFCICLESGSEERRKMSEAMMKERCFYRSY